MKRNHFNLQIAAFLIIRTVINTCLRMVGPFLLVFAKGVGSDINAMSAAVSVSFAAAAVGPFLAQIADRYGRKSGMLLGLVIFTTGVGLMLIWPVYMAFLIALLMASLGNNLFLSGIQAYISDMVPYEKRGFSLSLLEISWAGSFIVGVPVIGFLIARAGWQSPFLSLFVLGVLSIAAVALLFPHTPPLVRAVGDTDSRFAIILRSPAALFGLAMAFLVIAGNNLISVIFGVWMEQSYGLKIAAIGAAATVIGFAELAGEGVVALVVDKLGKHRTIAIGFVVNIFSAVIPFFIQGSIVGALIWLFIFYFSFEVTFAAAIPLMSEVLPQARATLLAVFLAASSLGMAAGVFFGPRIYEAGGFTVNVIVAMLVNIIGLIMLPRVRRALA
ncbi:MAG: MFS transporter [Leptolinea sp.]